MKPYNWHHRQRTEQLNKIGIHMYCIRCGNKHAKQLIRFRRVLFHLQSVNKCGVGVCVCILSFLTLIWERKMWWKPFCLIDDTKRKRMIYTWIHLCFRISDNHLEHRRVHLHTIIVWVAENAFIKEQRKVKLNLGLLCAHRNNCFYSMIKGYFQAHPDWNLINV